MSESKNPTKEIEQNAANKADLLETEIVTVSPIKTDVRLHNLTCKAIKHGVSLPIQFAIRELKPNSFVAIGVRPSLASSDERLIVDSEEIILSEESSA